MVAGLVVLLACQLAGELVVRALGVNFPGPLVGFLLFLVVLRIRRADATSGSVRAAELLLRWLPLLYVPAGVGVVSYLSMLGAQAWPVAAGLVLSWLAGLAVTAGVMALGLRVTDRSGIDR